MPRASRPGLNMPRTRCEEMMRARGLTQVVLTERVGWHTSNLSRLMSGRISLTQANAEAMAEALECRVSHLYEQIGEPVPPRISKRADRKPPINGQAAGFAIRLQALATALGAETPDDLLMYI